MPNLRLGAVNVWQAIVWFGECHVRGVSVCTYSECGRFQTGFVFRVYLLWIVLLLVLIWHLLLKVGVNRKDLVYIEVAQSKCDKAANSIVQQISDSPSLIFKWQRHVTSSHLKAKPSTPTPKLITTKICMSWYLKNQVVEEITYWSGITYLSILMVQNIGSFMNDKSKMWDLRKVLLES